MSILGNNLLAEYYAQNQGLPFGYEAVEYLESSGSQYIDSGVNAGLNIEALLVFSASAFTDTVNSGNGFIGARSSPNSNSCCAFFYRYNASLAVYLDFNNSDHAPYRAQRLVYTGYPIALNTKCSLIISRQVRRLSYVQNGGVLKENTTTNNDIFDNPSTLYVGQVNQTGLDLHALHGRIYYSLIRDTGLAVRHFIPCIRKSDGKPGMYDLCRSICPLTGTPFYINAGTGEFVTP